MKLYICEYCTGELVGTCENAGYLGHEGLDGPDGDPGGGVLHPQHNLLDYRSLVKTLTFIYKLFWYLTEDYMVIFRTTQLLDLLHLLYSFHTIRVKELITCSETTLIGESRFHISIPLGIWTWVPCKGKQTGSPLDQWDRVRMKWDCMFSTGLPPSSRLHRWRSASSSRRCHRSSVWWKAGRRTCSERETGTEKLLLLFKLFISF